MFCTWFSRISTIFAGISFFSCISPDGFAVIFLTLGECPGWFLRKVAIKHGHMLLTCHTLCEKLQAIWQISQVITSFLGPLNQELFRENSSGKGRKCTRQSRKVNSRNPWCLVLTEMISPISLKLRGQGAVILQLPAIPLGVVACTFEPFYHFPTTLLETAVQRRVTVKKLALLLSPCTATMHLIACMVHCIVAMILCLIR